MVSEDDSTKGPTLLKMLLNKTGIWTTWVGDQTITSTFLPRDITNSKTGEDANAYFDLMRVPIMPQPKKLVLMNMINWSKMRTMKTKDVNARYENMLRLRLGWQMCPLIPIRSDGLSRCVKSSIPQLPLLDRTQGSILSTTFELQDEVLTAKEYDEAREQWKKRKRRIQ